MSAMEKLYDSIAFDALVRRAESDGTLNRREVTAVISGVFSGRWISIARFLEIQSIFAELRVDDPSSKKMIEGFLATNYYLYILSYLRSISTGSKRSAEIPYTVDHIPKTTANNRRPALVMKAKYLTIHSTGNPSSSAKNERAWLTNSSNNRTASFHIVVDQSEAVECLPVDEVAWHAGDGNGDGNKKSISLEICESGNRSKTLNNAITLSARILQNNGLDEASLRRHHDWATKVCPRILIDAGFRAKPEQTWEWFKEEVGKLL